MFSYRNYTIKRYWRESLFAILLALSLVVWVLVYQHKTGLLKVYFLDVGQGDAIFVETPSRRQILIDGGRNKKVVSELGRIMSFGDRSIDVVIATHPDADHIGGLPEVASRFDIGVYLEPGVESENSFDDELHARLEDKNTQTLLARRGTVINFGDGARLTILFPDQDVSNWETNDASVVARLDYGESSFLFTGDSPIRIENTLIYQSKQFLDTDVLKVGHHGSRTSTSLSYAEAVFPEYAVVSAGRDNTYGHPHKEVLNILAKIGAKVVSTAESGTLEFETDGEMLRLK